MPCLVNSKQLQKDTNTILQIFGSLFSAFGFISTSNEVVTKSNIILSSQGVGLDTGR